jgi:hypothetical protein
MVCKEQATLTPENGAFAGNQEHLRRITKLTARFCRLKTLGTRGDLKKIYFQGFSALNRRAKALIWAGQRLVRSAIVSRESFKQIHLASMI